MQTNFSSDEQVQKSYAHFQQVDKPACGGCARGVRMCYTTPCIGSVEDIEKLLDAGYAKHLMLDWWVGEGSKEKAYEKFIGRKTTANFKNLKENPFEEDVCYLVPAIRGMEGKKAPYRRSGVCNLLIDNKCSLHDKDLKPIQGRTACCSIERMYFDENGRQQRIDERIAILHTWNTAKGVAVIERWKKEVGYVPESEDDDVVDLPDSKEDMLESLMDLMNFHAGKHWKVDGCPKVDDKNPPVEKVIMYEKPY